jgi:hypothetical protein
MLACGFVVLVEMNKFNAKVFCFITCLFGKCGFGLNCKNWFCLTAHSGSPLGNKHQNFLTVLAVSGLMHFACHKLVRISQKSGNLRVMGAIQQGWIAVIHQQR